MHLTWKSVIGFVDLQNIVTQTEIENSRCHELIQIRTGTDIQIHQDNIFQFIEQQNIYRQIWIKTNISNNLTWFWLLQRKWPIYRTSINLNKKPVSKAAQQLSTSTIYGNGQLLKLVIQFLSLLSFVSFKSFQDKFIVLVSKTMVFVCCSSNE